MYPHERSLVARMKGQPFTLIGVNSDKMERVKEAIKKENITWRSWFDGGSTGGPIAKQFSVRGWPTLFLIDHEGIIRNKWVGSPGGETLDREIEKLVALAAKAKK